MGIRPCPKWWQTILEIEISYSQWEGLTCIQSALFFFLILKFWVGGGGGFYSFSFVPNMFLSNYEWVPIRFSICSPRMFPIAPRFNPICFCQSPPLFSYIGGPKGEALYFSIESSILGSLHSFKFFLRWANQFGSLQKKKRLDLWDTPN